MNNVLLVNGLFEAFFCFDQESRLKIEVIAGRNED